MALREMFSTYESVRSVRYVANTIIGVATGAITMATSGDTLYNIRQSLEQFPPQLEELRLVGAMLSTASVAITGAGFYVNRCMKSIERSLKEKST